MITTYKQLKKKLNKIEEGLPRPPYHAHFSVDCYGNFDIKDGTVLTPDEALRLGQWMVKFYKGADNEDNY